MPLRYLFAFRSNMVYLSRGSICASVGISAFHRSNDLSVSPFFASALESVSTTWSTARNRFRCRYFWVGERRQGIFLFASQRSHPGAESELAIGTDQRRPPLREFVILKGPNMFVAVGARKRSSRAGMDVLGTGCFVGLYKKTRHRPWRKSPIVARHEAKAVNGWRLDGSHSEPRDPPSAHGLRRPRSQG